MYLVHSYRCYLPIFSPTTALFWASPKRFPVPLEFNAEDSLHLNFIIHTAYLFAHAFQVPTPSPIDRAWVAQVAKNTAIPEFKFREGKRIETDPNASGEKKKEEEQVASDENELRDALEELIRKRREYAHSTTKPPAAEQFEKDDDSNHHVDFIAAIANLRARNYTIDESDRLTVVST